MFTAVDDAAKMLRGCEPNSLALSQPSWGLSRRGPGDPAEAVAQASLLRCIFGNPFRAAPINFTRSSGWATATVVRMAQIAYSEQKFDHLPILADALEEAGCDDAEVLAHCREPGPHARGCWVIDLLARRR
jgi:hypothetical protein